MACHKANMEEPFQLSRSDSTIDKKGNHYSSASPLILCRQSATSFDSFDTSCFSFGAFIAFTPPAGLRLIHQQYWRAHNLNTQFSITTFPQILPDPNSKGCLSMAEGHMDPVTKVGLEWKLDQFLWFPKAIFQSNQLGI